MIKTTPVTSGKYHRVFVLGMKSSGKTSLLDQVIFSKRPSCDTLLTSPSSSSSSIPSTVKTINVPLSSSTQNNHHNHNNHQQQYSSPNHYNGMSNYNNHNNSHEQILSLNNSPGKINVNVSTINLPPVVHNNDYTNDTGAIEDTYAALVENEEKGVKELIYFYETPGIPNLNMCSPELIKNCIYYADAFILVYCINSAESFRIMEYLKKSIDKLREKRDIPIIILGNKLDRFRERQLDKTECLEWSLKEKVHLVEVTATERSTITEPFLYLASRLNPASQSKLNKLSAKRTTSQIPMNL